MAGLATILHAEDDPDEAFFLARTLRKQGVPLALQQVPDGQAAIEYLSGATSFRDRQKYPLPVAVLLDIKMPRKDGFDVLEWVRKQPQFRSLPVIVLTSSERPEDQRRAAALGATAYMTKGFDWSKVLEKLREVLGTAGFTA